MNQTILLTPFLIFAPDLLPQSKKKPKPRTNYYEIWKSEEWKEKKKIQLEKDSHKCRWCNSTEFLTLAHEDEWTTYKMSNEEYLKTDRVLILCRNCHYAKTMGNLPCPKCNRTMKPWNLICHKCSLQESKHYWGLDNWSCKSNRYDWSGPK